MPSSIASHKCLEDLMRCIVSLSAISIKRFFDVTAIEHIDDRIWIGRERVGESPTCISLSSTINTFSSRGQRSDIDCDGAVISRSGRLLPDAL